MKVSAEVLEYFASEARRVGANGVVEITSTVTPSTRENEVVLTLSEDGKEIASCLMEEWS